MTSQVMKALCLQTGYSQAELGAAIIMSRESIGCMERSGRLAEKRTDLALRYITLRGLEHEHLLERVKAKVSQSLDDASVWASPSFVHPETLKKALDDWSAVGGEDAGRQPIHRTQDVIGAIYVLEPTHGGWNQGLRDVARIELEGATVAT